MKKSIFSLLFFIIVTLSFSQTSTQIKRKDIILLNKEKVLSSQDLRIIESYNFDEYRRLDKRMQIQLINGPLIELLSINEVKDLGINFPIELIDEAIKKKSITYKHEIVLLLNIGLGITQIEGEG